nr:MAG TPA: hypothetical protein [Caudoviricetes sp.]
MSGHKDFKRSKKSMIVLLLRISHLSKKFTSFA